MTTKRDPVSQTLPKMAITLLPCPKISILPLDSKRPYLSLPHLELPFLSLTASSLKSRRKALWLLPSLTHIESEQHQRKPLIQKQKSPWEPLVGSWAVMFLLHQSPWQHSTAWPGDGGVLQVIFPCSQTWKQPFWQTWKPSFMLSEEKHCWPSQWSSLPQERPSHTHM